MCFTPMNHGHSPALQPETNSFHLGTNTEIGKPQLSRKWVPKTPGKILPSEKLHGMTDEKVCVYCPISIWRMKQNKPNPGPTRLRFSFLPYFRTWCLAITARNRCYICPQMGNAFSTCLLKKKLEPKILELESFENYQFFTAFSQVFVGLTKKKHPRYA